MSARPPTDLHGGTGDPTATDSGSDVRWYTAIYRWHPRVRLLLALGVLLPSLAVTILTTSDASSQWSTRQNAQDVARQAVQLRAVALARSELIDLATPLDTVSYARHVGLSIETASALLDVDFSRAIAQGEESVTANPILRSTPTLRADDATFLNDVPKILSGAVDFAKADNLTEKFVADLVLQWDDDYNALQDAVARSQLPGAFELHVTALRQTFQAFVDGGFAVQNATFVLSGEGGPAARQGVIVNIGDYTAATQQFNGRLGPKGQAAWTALQANRWDRAFQGTLQEAIDVALNERPAPWASHPALAGRGMTNGLKFLNDLSTLVRADSADLQVSADAQASAATWNFAKDFVFLFLLAGISLSGLVLVSRSLHRPLQKLAAAAHKVSGGEFDLEPLSDRGPREVVATNLAFNDMASTLKAVEARAVALAAEDLSHPELQIPLPGRTGQALQATVDKLTARISERELQRQALHEVATHDRLTGLLNRAAIFDFLSNDVVQRRHSGETVAVLFIDLDGLKPINDTYGHEVGDRAIMATADALAETIGTCGIVGRLGGDEFLVVLSGEERRTVGSVADRIRAAVAARGVSSDGLSIPLRCSIGIAFAEEGSDTDPMELVRQADVAMYEAKKAAHASAEQLAAALLQNR